MHFSLFFKNYNDLKKNYVKNIFNPKKNVWKTTLGRNFI